MDWSWAARSGASPIATGCKGGVARTSAAYHDEP